VSIDQQGELAADGQWTLLKPDQETVEGSSAKISLTDFPAGPYTFFMVPPDGETAEIDLIRNDGLETTAPRPQISFTAPDGDVIRLSISLKLTEFGTVGVNSDPPGMKFELRGPNGTVQEGVSPATFQKQAVGNYSVQYQPQGCPQPPGK